LLEVGPHSTLQGAVRDVLKEIGKDKKTTYNSILVRNISALQTTMEVAGQLHCTGYPLDVAKVNSRGVGDFKSSVVLTDLPEYPFNHSQSYWHESRFSGTGYRFRKFPRLDLVGTPAWDWNPLEAKWRNIIRVSEIPWIEDHKV